MRSLLLIAGAALALAACKNNDQSDKTQNVDENLTAESIVSNDVTAIDAVTGEAANMAADVDMNFGGPEESSPATSSNEARPARSAPARRPAAPAVTSTANAAANLQ